LFDQAIDAGSLEGEFPKVDPLMAGMRHEPRFLPSLERIRARWPTCESAQTSSISRTSCRRHGTDDPSEKGGVYDSSSRPIRRRQSGAIDHTAGPRVRGRHASCATTSKGRSDMAIAVKLDDLLHDRRTSDRADLAGLGRARALWVLTTRRPPRNEHPLTSTPRSMSSVRDITEHVESR
jgi:hypothetical protein